MLFQALLTLALLGCVCAYTRTNDRDVFTAGEDNYRFLASYFDEVEAAVDWFLDEEITKIHLIGGSSPEVDFAHIELAFNLTMTNHNMRASKHLNTSDGILVAGNITVVTEALDALKEISHPPLPAEVFTVIILADACDHFPSFSGLVDDLDSANVNATVYCSRLLPDEGSSLDYASALAAFKTATDAIDFTTQDTPLLYDYGTYTGENGLPIGPFVLTGCAPGCSCPCYQGLRHIWLIDVNMDLIGSASSYRGACGAPIDVLPAEERSIVLGQSAAFSGPSKHMGAEMLEGILKGLDATLEDQAVPRVIVMSWDDGYNPDPAYENTDYLIMEQDVLAIIGSTGTPTAARAYPHAIGNKVPFVCPFTGARFLRKPASPYQVNVRASYDDEAEAFVSYMISEGSTKFAFFGQNDGYGNAVIGGLQLSLLKRGLEVMSDGRYERNTADIADGLALMVDVGPPNAVFMGGTATALAAFVTEAKLVWPKTVYACVSFVGASTFRAALGDAAPDVMVMQSIYPGESFLDDDGLVAYNWIIDEGELCGRMLGSIFMDMNREYTRENFVETVYGTGSFFELRPGETLGPMTISTVENCTQGIQTVFVTRFDDDGNTEIVSRQDQPECGQNLEPPIVDSIKFGMTAAFSGPSSGLGLNMRDGIEAALYRFNTRGGVNGRLVRLIARDDGYNPAPALENAMDMVVNETVFGLLGCTGTPTAAAMTPWLLENKVPFLQPFTGARFLRDHTKRYFVNLRSSYDDEVTAFVRYAIARGRLRISIFYQNDGFGAAGVNALDLAMHNAGLTLFSNGTYERNTDDVEDGLAGMSKAGVAPQAVVMIGTAIALAKFVSLAQTEWGFPDENGDIVPNDAIFHTVSFVGSEVYSDNLRNRSVAYLDTNVFVTQVVPFVQGVNESMVYQEYAADLLAFCDDCTPGFGSMEGYLGARMVLDSLAEVELLQDLTLDLDDPTTLQAVREAFLDNLYFGSTYSAGDLQMGPFLSDCNQGLYSTYLTSVNSETGLYIDHPEWAFSWDVCNENIFYLEDDEIPLVFGQSAAFSGVAADLGREMREGIQGALNLYNDAALRKAYLLTCDDGYEPAKAIVCLDFFLSNPKVLAMVGSVGTPTASAMIDKILEVELPWIGPFTGARYLRNPFKRPILNVRASYDDEVAAMVQYLVDNNRARRISIMYQNDGFGAAGYNALTLSLDFHLREIYSEGTYERNTVDVSDGIASIFPTMDNDVDDIPDAVIMIGTALPLSTFVRLVVVGDQADNIAPVYSPDGSESYCTGSFQASKCIWFYTVSFVGSNTFAENLGTLSVQEDIYISQVVPIPSDDLASDDPVFMASYDSALASLEIDEFGVVGRSLGSMEGYLTGSVLTQSMKDMTIFTRPKLIDAFYSVDHNVDGLAVGPFSDSEGDECNQGLRFVIISKIEYTGGDPAYEFSNVYQMDFPESCGVLDYFAPPNCQNGTETIELFPGVNTKAICEDCDRGYFSAFGQACQACPIGWTSATVSAECSSCAAGTYAPDVGSYACLECPAGKYNDEDGLGDCQECPANADGTVGANNRSACLCRPGYYKTDEEEWICAPCNTPDWSIPGRPCLLPAFESSGGLRMPMFFLAALSVIFSIVSVLLILKDSTALVYKATSYRFLIINIMGAVIAQFEVFLSLGYPGSVSMCSIVPFVHSVGFGLMLGSLIVKEWRVVQIFSTVFYRRRLSDQLLYKYLGSLVLLGVLNNVVTSITSPVEMDIVDSSTLYASYEQCTTKTEFTWVSSRAIFDWILILLSLNYAWQGRKVPSKYSESAKVTQVLYNVAICSVLDMTLPMVMESPDAQFAVHSAMIILMSTVNVALLFIPKFLAVRNAAAGGSQGSRKSGRSDGSAGLESSGSDFTVEALLDALAGWKDGKPFPEKQEKQIEGLLLRLRNLDQAHGSSASGAPRAGRGASAVQKKAPTKEKEGGVALKELKKNEGSDAPAKV